MSSSSAHRPLRTSEKPNKAKFVCCPLQAFEAIGCFPRLIATSSMHQAVLRQSIKNSSFSYVHHRDGSIMSYIRKHKKLAPYPRTRRMRRHHGQWGSDPQVEGGEPEEAHRADDQRHDRDPPEPL